MSDKVSTATNDPNFPTLDITHKPRRTQFDNLRATDPSPAGEASTDAVNVPQNITIERAIKYYDEHVDDPLMGRLYRQTATWLKDLLDKSHKPSEEE